MSATLTPGNLLPEGVTPRKVADSEVLRPVAHPVLTLKEYKGDPTSVEEFMIVPHNAIRRELFDFFAIMDKLHELQYRISRYDLIDVQTWWRVFYLFLKDYLDFEKKVFYPLLEDMAEEDGQTGRMQNEVQRLEEKRTRIIELLPDLNFFMTMESPDSREVFGSCIPLIDMVFPLMVEYFLDQERSLPPLMEEFMTTEDVKLAKLDLVDFIFYGRDPETNLVILSRWIEDERLLRDWVSLYVPKGKHFANYQSYMNAFVAGHRGVVARIKALKKEDIRRARTVAPKTKAPLRTPVFYMAEYGLSTIWSSDPIVLVHNAIRREIMDLYYILTSVESRRSEMPRAEVTEFRLWWEAFAEFVALYVVIENEKLFPWIAGGASDGSEAQALILSLRMERDEILAMMREAGEAVSTAEGQTSEGALNTVLQKMDSFAPSLLQYFRKMEASAPPFVEQRQAPESKDAIEHDIFMRYSRAPGAPIFVPILLRGIESKDVVDQFFAENVKGLARLRWQGWSRKFKDQHWKVVENFHKRTKGETVAPMLTPTVVSPGKARKKKAVLMDEANDDPGAFSVSSRKFQSGLSKSKSKTGNGTA